MEKKKIILIASVGLVLFGIIVWLMISLTGGMRSNSTGDNKLPVPIDENNYRRLQEKKTSFLKMSADNRFLVYLDIYAKKFVQYDTDTKTETILASDIEPGIDLVDYSNDLDKALTFNKAKGQYVVYDFKISKRFYLNNQITAAKISPSGQSLIYIYDDNQLVYAKYDGSDWKKLADFEHEAYVLKWLDNNSVIFGIVPEGAAAKLKIANLTTGQISEFENKLAIVNLATSPSGSKIISYTVDDKYYISDSVFSSPKEIVNFSSESLTISWTGDEKHFTDYLFEQSSYTGTLMIYGLNGQLTKNIKLGLEQTTLDKHSINIANDLSSAYFSSDNALIKFPLP